jgi:ribosomal protein S18 acetylase RimI-like enzyme
MDYTYRAPAEADFDGFYRLYRDQLIEEFGSCAMPPEEVRAELNAPGYDWAQMMRLAFHPDHTDPVGYVEVRSFHTPAVRINSYGWVRPEPRGRGVGTRLVELASDMAALFVPHVPPDARVVLQAFTMTELGIELFRNVGFEPTRESHIMQIDFEPGRPPREPEWPDGFEIVALADGLELRDLVSTLQISFRDHRGSVDEPLDDLVATWEHLIAANASAFLPSLFCQLRHRGDPAGEVILWSASEEDTDKAFVQSLGVLPEYRRRGLGTKLLEYGFARAYAMGKHAVSLNVDASSLTGADRLYRNAGMYTFRVFTALEREIRAGREISNQG